MKQVFHLFLALTIVLTSTSWARETEEIAQDHRKKIQEDLGTQVKALQSVLEVVQKIQKDLSKNLNAFQSDTVKIGIEKNAALSSAVFGAYGVAVLTALFRGRPALSMISKGSLAVAYTATVAVSTFGVLDTFLQEDIDAVSLNQKIVELDGQLRALSEGTQDYKTRLKVSSLRDGLARLNIQADFETRKAQGRELYTAAGGVLTLAAAAPYIFIENKRIAVPLASVLGSVAYFASSEGVYRRQDILALINALKNLEISLNESIQILGTLS